VNLATRATASRARNSCSRARPLGRCRVRAGHSLGPTGVRISTDGDARWCATVVFLNNRYLDPVLGRFVSVDPLVSLTRDAYGYGNNNPITYSDPTGLEAGSWYDDSNTYAASEKARPLASAAEVTAAYDAAVAACNGGCKDNTADANLRIMQSRRPDGVPRTDGIYLVAGLAVVMTGGAAAALGGGSTAFAACIRLCTPAGTLISGLADPNADPAVGAGSIPFRSNTAHIFREATGHLLEDTPAGRALIQSAIDEANLVATRNIGSSVLRSYQKILADGRQVWAEVRDGVEITNGGVNTTPR
jgi:RHS repeat-associated protein